MRVGRRKLVSHSKLSSCHVILAGVLVAELRRSQTSNVVVDHHVRMVVVLHSYRLLHLHVHMISHMLGGQVVHIVIAHVARPE